MRQRTVIFPDSLSAFAPILCKAARVTDVSPGGKLVVDYDGNRSEPLEARCLRGAMSSECRIGCPVLLLFEDQDPMRPIVIGVLEDSLPVATLDGSRMVIRADREISLECGRSSLLLRSDGKVVLKGVDVVSRASRTNKVRGASVKIN